MTIKELKKMLESIPDDYIFFDRASVREITKNQIDVDNKEKIVGFIN